MTRLSKHRYWMGLAEAASMRSHDDETKVGGVLIKNDTGMLVATGHNDSRRREPHISLRKVRYSYRQLYFNYNIKPMSEMLKTYVASWNYSGYM